MKWRALLPLSKSIARTRSIGGYRIKSRKINWRVEERTMDKRKSKTFRDALMSRREGLVGQVQAAEAYSRERDAEATQDPADMAANAYTKELLMSMSTNDRQLLESIDAALYRIADGDYGKCDHCGEPIQDKRLEAVPWARHCLRCQDLNERGLLIPDED